MSRIPRVIIPKATTPGPESVGAPMLGAASGRRGRPGARARPRARRRSRRYAARGAAGASGEPTASEGVPVRPVDGEDGRRDADDGAGGDADAEGAGGQADESADAEAGGEHAEEEPAGSEWIELGAVCRQG